MSFKGYFLFNCIQYLICISLNEYPAILFFEYFKISLVKVHFFKDLVGFPFLCHFHLRKKRCGKDILKKKTRQKDAPNYSSIYFFLLLQSVVDFCLRRRCGTMCEQESVQTTEDIRSNWFLLFLDTISVSVRFVPLLFYSPFEWWPSIRGRKTFFYLFVFACAKKIIILFVLRMCDADFIFRFVIFGGFMLIH